MTQAASSPVVSESGSVPVIRIARRRAKSGQEAAYEKAVGEMFAAMRSFKGYVGADLIAPEAPGEEYQVVVRFSSEADLQLWDQSATRAAAHRRLREVAEGDPEYRRLSGLEAWFAPAIVPATMHPPRFKMATVTWLGIFPTVSAVLWFVAPLLAALPFLIRTALLTMLIVALMTWVVMPRLTKRFRWWLAGK